MIQLHLGLYLPWPFLLKRPMDLSFLIKHWDVFG